MKPCFKHLFCACSAGRLDNFQHCLCLYVVFLFNNFCPKHATEAADTLKPSERCSFKESSHGQSFDSLSPNNRQTGPQQLTTSAGIGQNKNIRFKGFMHFRNNGSSPLCLFFFPFQFQVCALQTVLWPLQGLLTYHISYKICSLVAKAESTEKQFLCTISPNSGIYLYLVESEF